ncbi:MAG TPA: SPOR domain-containing protein [Sphingomicrobium sp.]|nr:SPOR domain-containing protein [Sphingomicrobium sp.]
MANSPSGYDETLPWLEAVDDEDGPSGVPARRMLAALLVVLIAAALVSVTFFWLGRQNAPEGGGAPQLIRADPGPYKVRPANPGGLDVAGESGTAFETSAGQDTDAELDLNRMEGRPPVVQRDSTPETKPAEAQKPAPAEPAARPTGGKGSVIQLGAFANRAQAERAWAALSARFPSVAAMDKMIVPFPGGIRLRAAAASAAEARDACQAVRAAGENCFIP